MTIEEMRAILGLASDVPDADVAQAYAEYLLGEGAPEELLPLASIKAYLRIDGDDEDPTLLDLRAAAIEWVESWTGHLLTRRTTVEGFDGFARIALDAWPIVSVDSVGYLDSAGVATTVDPAAYRLVAVARPARVVLNVGRAWPVAQRGDDMVTVTVTAGYATADAVPRQLRQAAMMIVAGLYENREVGGLSADVERAATSLCRSYRRWAI